MVLKGNQEESAIFGGFLKQTKRHGHTSTAVGSPFRARATASNSGSGQWIALGSLEPLPSKWTPTKGTDGGHGQTGRKRGTRHGNDYKDTCSIRQKAETMQFLADTSSQIAINFAAHDLSNKGALDCEPSPSSCQLACAMNFHRFVRRSSELTSIPKCKGSMLVLLLLFQGLSLHLAFLYH